MVSPLLQLPNTYRAFYGAFIGLHPIQLQAIEPVLANRDLILQSATGSGKTEAVLAPCLEAIISSDRRRAGLYIVPTRALAFDIRRRFADILKERLGIRLAIRTGDIKSTGGGHPDIMLTTPESLDVMLGSSNSDLQAFLLRVRTVIIDEVHPFVHQYRGQQLAYLLQRLERRVGTRLQRIALSATIADPDAVGRFLHFRPDFVLLSENIRRKINPRLIHLKDDEDELINLLSDLSHEWKYNKILIFANSRGRCDKIFGLLNGQGSFKGVTLLHYSNLNTRERQVVEQRFRRQNRAVCVATSTLELGIDVGDVDAVLLFEPPDSVSAFLQRIGRANRRQKTIHFWGVCRGGRAGEQLLRFLALLRLAEEGLVEMALSDQMPSVLSQQFISCLYEKKRLTLTALQKLFSNHSEKQIEEIFNSLVQKRWLKKNSVNGLYGGGYQYWQALVDYKIWSNFPENEELYQLLVEEESVADIPKSIVKQIEPGDRLLLAGRRLKIVWIDNGELKRILAKPARRLDDKELLWLGKGSHVSYEVAQAMRLVLKSTGEEENQNTSWLFSRSRKLLCQQLAIDKRAVVLENGIELVRLMNGSYQYRTFIGAVGNLILTWSIREFFAELEEDIHVTPDEIGLVCSAQISFEKLDLPLTEADFDSWLNRHFKMMVAMFAMNAFCTTLPGDLLRLELAGFIRDRRLLDFFALCRNRTSVIVDGDPENLRLQPAVSSENIVQEISSQSGPLLEWERKRRRNDSCSFSLLQTVFRPRAITGTLIGEYFRHQQCDRWFSLQFLRSQEQSSYQLNKKDTGLSSLRFARGIAFEEKVIAHLVSRNKIFATVSHRDDEGRIRSITARSAETLSWFRQAGKQWHSGNCYIVQPVLSVDSILQIPSQLPLTGVGIPDLIQLKVKEGEDSFILQIGDIKSSTQPRYYQKWQVAFYVWLLHQLIDKDERYARFRVAASGFILTPGTAGDLAIRHVFDLKPYLTSMMAVLENFKTVLGSLPWQSFWQLRRHCTSCQSFELCYQQAINEEDIQFVPGSSRGVLLKMRTNGIKNLHQEADVESVFISGQKKALQRAMTALNRNIITVNSKKTDLFPANITTLFIIHLVVDPVSGIVETLGFARQKKGKELQISSWTATTGAEQLRIWQDFSSRLSQLWHDSIEDNRGPHILLFGQETRQGIQNLADLMADKQLKTFLSPGNSCHYTNLQQLLTNHFSLPLPGIMTLYGLNRILALMPEVELPVPESLLHSDRFSEIEFSTVCEFISKLWQWITSYLKSRYQKNDWSLQEQTGFKLSKSCQEFITAERLHRQRDIAALMELSLAERKERFRAMGPIRLTETTLDEEGKNLYLFSKTANENDHDRETLRNIPAKFRSGDFLRLVPLGVTDLQSGIPVIMADFNTRSGEVAVYPRRNGAGIFKEVSYSLEEDGEDYQSARLLDVVQKAFTVDNPQMTELFGGTFTYKKEEPNDAHWLQNWLHSEAAVAHLNPSQQQALKLPFQYALSLIIGPPGTGKTYLLGWVIIALFRQAQRRGTSLRIAVSAVTHKAIDQVLNKLVTLVNDHKLQDFPVRCLKWGRWEGEQFDPDNARSQVEPCNNAREIADNSYLIVGATGFGFHAMMQGQKEDVTTRKFFDWVIFDEASQILIPQALLALVYGKGNFLFLGDTCQLPPIIRSSIFKDEMDKGDSSSGAETRSSVLEILLKRYPQQNHQLNITYRMNRDICRFPSRTWYDGLLCPAPANSDNILPVTGSADNDLLDKIIDPLKPVVLVGVDHQGCSQEAEIEAELLANLAHRLLEENGLNKEQIAILSPHRAQNNAIAEYLTHLLGHDNLPVIDTVERMQGAERDVILFGFTSSDPDLIFSEFLNNPNRFNVVLTRARKKVIVVGSKLFWGSIASTEKQLRDNACFKEFFSYCCDNDWYFDYSSVSNGDNYCP